MTQSKLKKPSFTLPAVTALALTAANITLALAQTPQLEEVVVTATKQEEGLQSIPISVGVITGEKMQEQGAFSLEDIVQFIPNVDITETSGNEKIFIRGIGTYGNGGFEQSVGTFVDGVYRGRGQASRAALIDVARVEVLKGPQNTLFGKNTISGAMNITSANPTDEFEASIMATSEPEFGGFGGQLVVSGPLSDTFRARLALRYDETDGYYDNKTIGQDERQEEEMVSRVTLDWDATENLNLNLKWEHGEQDTIGRQNNIGVTTPTADFIYRSFGDPNFQSGRNHDKYMDGALPGRDNQFDDSEWDLISLTADWQIGDFSFRSISGWVDAVASNSLDLDFAPIDLIGQQRREDHEQFTQEFLLFSPKGQAIEYLAGFFYQDEDLQSDGDLELYLTGLAPLFATNPLFPFIQQGLGDSTQARRYGQKSETISAFTQITFNTTDKLSFDLGVRYSEDEKVLNKSLVLGGFQSEGYVPYNVTRSLPHTAFADQFLNFAREHHFDDNGFETCNTTILPQLAQVCNVAPGFNNVRKEDHVTGDLIAQYDLSDDAMVYAKWGVGYKAGGFDNANNIGDPDSQEFEDETAESWEFGAKLEFWDGRAEANIAIFQNQFEDLQVSVFDGQASFEVRNAAEATSQGVEVDGRVALTDGLTMFYALAYLDSTFDAFPGAPCHAGLAASWPGPGPCVADLAGQTTQFAPEYSGNLSFDYQASLTDGLDLGLGLDLIYKDSYLVTGDNDPALEQDSFTKVNARIALMGGDTWSLAVLGKNLTDEYVVNAPDDIPLGGFGFAGSYFFFADAPRSYELQVTYRF